MWPANIYYVGVFLFVFFLQKTVADPALHESD